MRFWAGRCTSKIRLDGKTAIITGANTGIGKSTALDFYKRGCTVIMACRDTEKARIAREEICESLKSVLNTGSLIVKKLDLACIKSIRSFAENILMEKRKIDLLINNAGVCGCPQSYTEDGFELHFGTNYLGHFLLTLLLLPRLIESQPARIVMVSSKIHHLGIIDFDNLNSEKSYNRAWAYINSKLAINTFAKELARRLEGTKMNIYVVHPGMVKTEIARHIHLLIPYVSDFVYNRILVYFLKAPEQGAQTIIHCSVEENVENETGLYYEDCKVARPSAESADMEFAKLLWDVSCDLVKLKDYDPFKKSSGG